MRSRAAKTSALRSKRSGAASTASCMLARDSMSMVAVMRLSVGLNLGLGEFAFCGFAAEVDANGSERAI